MSYLGSKQDVRVTYLESEENKTGFNEKNQYRDGILSSTQAERLHDECTETPAISLHSQPPGCSEYPRSDVPQFIRNHQCRDGVRRDGEHDGGIR